MRMIPRFLRYSGVALLSAGGDWLLFSLLVSGLGLAHLPSLMAARVGGGLLSFFANRHWTWTPRHAVSRQGRRFLVLYGFSYGLAVAVFWLLVDVLGLSAYPGKLITDATCFLVNYAAMQSYVFHDRIGLARFLPMRRDFTRGGVKPS